MEIIINLKTLEGSINLIGEDKKILDRQWGDKQLTERKTPVNLTPHPDLPNDSRLWAALQSVSGGTWGGCVFDVDAIINHLEAGKKMLNNDKYKSL